jgi:hypothetical protein
MDTVITQLMRLHLHLFSNSKNTVTVHLPSLQLSLIKDMPPRVPQGLT